MYFISLKLFLFLFLNKKSFKTRFLAGAYSEPNRASRMELLAKLVNTFKPFTVFLQRTLSETFGGVLNTLCQTLACPIKVC